MAAFTPIKTTQYEGIKLEEYMGNYTVSLMKDNKGTFYPQWAKYVKFKGEYQERDWPVRVALGDKQSAINALKALIRQIEHGGEDDVMF